MRIRDLLLNILINFNIIFYIKTRYIKSQAKVNIFGRVRASYCRYLPVSCDNPTIVLVAPE